VSGEIWEKVAIGSLKKLMVWLPAGYYCYDGWLTSDVFFQNESLWVTLFWLRQQGFESV
jgi:hypothetical protein